MFTTLYGDDYIKDFEENFWRMGPSNFWKLERLQTFREPNDASWVAFDSGDWTKSMQLLEKRRPSLKEHYNTLNNLGIKTRRVRVVEEPLTPYMTWELQLLALRDELGGTTRVIKPEIIKQYEGLVPLPEIITLSDDIMYHLMYDSTGLQEGGMKGTKKTFVSLWSEFIAGLFNKGEPISSYMSRTKEY